MKWFKRSCLNWLSIFCSKYKVLMFFVRINCTKAIFSAMPTAPPLPQLGGYQDIGFGLGDAGLWVFAIWLLEYNLWMLIEIHPRNHKLESWDHIKLVGTGDPRTLFFLSQTPVFWRFQWLLGHEKTIFDICYCQLVEFIWVYEDIMSHFPVWGGFGDWIYMLLAHLAALLLVNRKIVVSGQMFWQSVRIPPSRKKLFPIGGFLLVQVFPTGHQTTNNCYTNRQHMTPPNLNFGLFIQVLGIPNEVYPIFGDDYSSILAMERTNFKNQWKMWKVSTWLWMMNLFHDSLTSFSEIQRMSWESTGTPPPICLEIRH